MTDDSRDAKDPGCSQVLMGAAATPPDHDEEDGDSSHDTVHSTITADKVLVHGVAGHSLVWAPNYVGPAVGQGISISSSDKVCRLVADDLVLSCGPELDAPDAPPKEMSLVNELERLNLRIDQMDEKHEMVLDRLDELLSLLKNQKKG